MTDTQCVFNLLIKVTNCCDEIGVPYYLGFYPMRLAMTQDELPTGIRTTEIYVFEEKIPVLCSRLKQEEGIEIESLETNPNFDDACIKVVDRHAVFFDLFNPNSITPSYSLIITPITSAPINNKKEKNLFIKKYYGAVKINRYVKKFNFGCLKLFRPSGCKIVVKRSKEHVSLLRYKYKKYRISKEYFSGGHKITINGHSFSCVKYAENFLKIYYRKDFDSYPLSSKIDVNRYILHPDIPYVSFNHHRPILIRFYGLLIRALTRTVKKDFSTIKKQKEYFFRTTDRFAMLDHYGPLKAECTTAYNARDWEKLGELLSEYIKISKKYKKNNLPFAFDYEFYYYLIEYLYYSKKENGLLTWLISQKAAALNYLEYVNSYEEK